MGIKDKRILFPIVWMARLIGRRFPTFMVKIRYFVRFKKMLNLESPSTLNEKILYLSLKTDTSVWTRLADKYNVREYLKENQLEEILVKCYGRWNNAYDIDFDSLPNSFVLKTVQGSGDICIVPNKNNINIEETVSRMQTAVKTKYGELEGGMHYMRIKPAIIAEELLFNDTVSAKYSSSIIDYKIWCFNGKPQFIFVCTNRDKQGAEVMTYNLDWEALPEYSIFTNHLREGHIIPKPDNLSKMLDIAQRLAEPFPVVRVDLYNIKGKIYFGELTFTSLGGLMDYYTDEFQQLAGSIIDLNYKP